LAQDLDLEYCFEVAGLPGKALARRRLNHIPGTQDSGEGSALDPHIIYGLVRVLVGRDIFLSQTFLAGKEEVSRLESRGKE
jgi:hypothetical protein